jgi:hypothetical protein
MMVKMSHLVQRIRRMRMNETVETMPNCGTEMAISMPKLHCLVSSGDTIKADLVATMPATIVAGERLYYFEVAATADSTAHAIAGALSESRIDAQWQIRGAPFCAEWKRVEVGGHVTIRDTRLEVPNFKGRLHHVAALDTSGELILAENDQSLWAKLRSRMSCPTLDNWGAAIMPSILRSGLLMPTQSYGIGTKLKGYILAPDASETFDRIIAEHVRRMGQLQPGLRRHMPTLREAA